MQLKTTGESFNALNAIKNITNSNSNLSGTLDTSASITNKLADASKKYSTEAIKMAIAQSTLNEEEIKAMLSKKGLIGKTLETTTAELAQITSTNALSASQNVATGSTLGLSNAMKGLGVSVKSFAAANAPLLAVLASLAAAYSIYKGVEFVQDWADGTLAINKYNKELEKSERIVENNQSTLSEYNSEMDANNSKIKELQELANNRTITEAQRAELENLKYQNALLDEKIKKLQQANNEETKKIAKTSVDKFNTEFGGNSEEKYQQFMNDNKNDYGINETLMLDGLSNNSASNQLLTLKYFTDAYNQSVEDLKNGVENVTQENVDNYSDALKKTSEQFSSISDTLWNDLQDQKSKLETVQGTDAFDENAYNNIISWENIFKNYVEEYKNAFNKVQSEANKNPVVAKIDYKASHIPQFLHSKYLGA